MARSRDNPGERKSACRQQGPDYVYDGRDKKRGPWLSPRVSLAVNGPVEMYLAPKLSRAFTRTADLPIERPSIAPSRRAKPLPRNQRWDGHAGR